MSIRQDIAFKNLYANPSSNINPGTAAGIGAGGQLIGTGLSAGGAPVAGSTLGAGVSGGLAGLQMGGPAGAAVGAGIGASVGLFSGLSKLKRQREREAAEAKARSLENIARIEERKGMQTKASLNEIQAALRSALLPSKKDS